MIKKQLVFINKFSINNRMADTNINKRILWMPIIKSKGDKYIAILSDNSIDRDDEVVSKSFLQKFANSQKKLPALMDHENKMSNLIGEWTNKRMENINGHDAFIAEPKFYLSNPNAKMIKGMLDEGAEVGVSIGAIVTKTSEVEIKGCNYKQFDDGEILEASFTPIQANRNAKALAIAKSFKSNMEVSTMSNDDSKKEDVQKAEDIKKSEEVQEPKQDLEKSLREEVERELEKYKQELEDDFSKKLDEQKSEMEKSMKDEIEKIKEDRHELLKKLKEEDNKQADKSKEVEVKKEISMEVEPTAGNLIAAMKGFKIPTKK